MDLERLPAALMTRAGIAAVPADQLEGLTDDLSRFLGSLGRMELAARWIRGGLLCRCQTEVAPPRGWGRWLADRKLPERTARRDMRLYRELGSGQLDRFGSASEALRWLSKQNREAGEGEPATPQPDPLTLPQALRLIAELAREVDWLRGKLTEAESERDQLRMEAMKRQWEAMND